MGCLDVAIISSPDAGVINAKGCIKFLHRSQKTVKHKHTVSSSSVQLCSIQHPSPGASAKIVLRHANFNGIRISYISLFGQGKRIVESHLQEIRLNRLLKQYI